MPRIAEKLEFIKGRAVKICTKAGIGRKAGHKKRVIIEIFTKTASKTKFLIVQGDFGKIIDIAMGKLCCLRVYLGNVG